MNFSLDYALPMQADVYAIPDRTYSDVMVDWLLDMGYTHCFFVSGGNIMHLLNAVRDRMTCVPVVHEVAAGIATEYFNAVRDPGSGRAFALVTAGPGLTNIVTAVAGAWLESRELLVIGGQVKSQDLALPGMRQRGLQEINGVDIVAPITKASVRLDAPIPRVEFEEIVQLGSTPRMGPVFLEVCLDVQGTKNFSADAVAESRPASVPNPAAIDSLGRPLEFQFQELLSKSERPVLLIGGGVDRHVAASLRPRLEALGLPVMTTWNGADRFVSAIATNWGRPNHFGQRAANVLLQQCDLLLCVGTRLGIQQTGFNWKEFAPLATKLLVEIDPIEFEKPNPPLEIRIHADANAFLHSLISSIEEDERLGGSWQPWRDFGLQVRNLLPPEVPGSPTGGGFVNPYEMMARLCNLASEDALICPSSSGGTFTGAYQSLNLRGEQRLISDKSLASMGYGLSGAIGMSVCHPGRQVILLEGDGGFAQNLQELGTVAAGNLNIIMFVFDNSGYGSIRTTQMSYFGGARVGCDPETGLGLPGLRSIAQAYGLLFEEAPSDDGHEAWLTGILQRRGPILVRVPVNPEQPYLPKIASRISSDGSMESAPLHLMHPPLDEATNSAVLHFLDSPTSNGD